MELSNFKSYPDAALKGRKEIIKNALLDGHDIPPEVLADYPELKEKSAEILTPLQELPPDAVTLIDIIAMNPKAENSEKYKKILMDQYGVNFDDYYHDDDYIASANLSDIKGKDDFLSFENYLVYAKKINGIRGYLFEHEIEGIISDSEFDKFKDKYKFASKIKEYTGEGNYASASTNEMIRPLELGIETFIHEFGHIIQFKSGYYGIASYPTHSSSTYGNSNASEVFAENFKNYFINAEKLKSLMPEVYAELDGIITDDVKTDIRELLSKNEATVEIKGVEKPEIGNKEPWQMTKAEFLSTEEIERDYDKQYLSGISKKDEPSSITIPPIGTWRMDKSQNWNKYGCPIEQLRQIPIDKIIGVESPREMGRGVYVDKYKEWINEGLTAPPIRTALLQSGTYKIHDGHRRLLAYKELGIKSILSWVSDWADTGLREPNGIIIETDLTHQLSIKQALSQGKNVPTEVLNDYPELKPVEAVEQPKITKVKFYDAYKENGAPLEEVPPYGYLKRLGTLSVHGDTSDETGRKIRWGVLLSNGDKVSMDGAIRITDPERWALVGDFIKAQTGIKKQKALIENSFTLSELEAVTDELFYDAIEAKFKQGDFGQPNFDRWMRDNDHILADLITYKLKTTDDKTFNPSQHLLSKWEEVEREKAYEAIKDQIPDLAMDIPVPLDATEVTDDVIWDCLKSIQRLPDLKPLRYIPYEKQKQIVSERIQNVINFRKNKAITLTDMEENTDTPTVDEVKLVEQTFSNDWNKIPEHMKYATPVKPTKFNPIPSDPNLAKIFDPIAADDALRPVMMGVNFDDKGITGSDAHVLAFIDADFKGEVGAYCITKTCKKGLPGSAGKIIEGNFPDYTAIIPKKMDFRYKIDLYKLKTYCEIVLRTGYLTETNLLLVFCYNGQENLIGLDPKLVIRSCTFMMQLGHTEGVIRLTKYPDKIAIICEPSAEAMEETFDPLESDFVLVMPKKIADGTHKGSSQGLKTFVGDLDYNTFLNLVYDFEQSVVYTEGGETVVYIDTNITKKEAESKQGIDPDVSDFIYRFLKNNKSRLPILDYAVSDGKWLQFSDLETTFKVNAAMSKAYYLPTKSGLMLNETHTNNDPDIAEYPLSQYVDSTKSDNELISLFEINKDFFADIMGKFSEFVADDDLRPAMKGVHIVGNKEDKTVKFEATDAHKAIVSTVKANVAKDFDIILPEPKRINDFFEAVKGDSNVKFSLTSNGKYVDINYQQQAVASIRAIDGQFPNIQKAFPALNPKKWSVNRRELIGLCAEIKDPNKNDRIGIAFKEDSDHKKLNVFTFSMKNNNDLQQKTLATIDAEISKNDIHTDIANSSMLAYIISDDTEVYRFDPKKIKESLSAIETTKVDLYLGKNSNVYVVIEPDGGWRVDDLTGGVTESVSEPEIRVTKPINANKYPHPILKLVETSYLQAEGRLGRNNAIEEVGYDLFADAQQRQDIMTAIYGKEIPVNKSSIQDVIREFKKWIDLYYTRDGKPIEPENIPEPEPIVIPEPIQDQIYEPIIEPEPEPIPEPVIKEEQFEIPSWMEREDVDDTITFSFKAKYNTFYGIVEPTFTDREYSAVVHDEYSEAEQGIYEEKLINGKGNAITYVLNRLTELHKEYGISEEPEPIAEPIAEPETIVEQPIPIPTPTPKPKRKPKATPVLVIEEGEEVYVEEEEQLEVVDDEAEESEGSGIKVKKEEKKKLEDFGEKVLGAKKYRYDNYVRSLSNDDKDIVKKPLSQTFPEPGYEKLIENGTVTQEVVCLMKAARGYLRDHKPTLKESWGYDAWVENVRGVMKFFKIMLHDQTDSRFIEIQKYLENDAPEIDDATFTRIVRLLRSYAFLSLNENQLASLPEINEEDGINKITDETLTQEERVMFICIEILTSVFGDDNTDYIKGRIIPNARLLFALDFPVSGYNTLRGWRVLEGKKWDDEHNYISTYGAYQKDEFVETYSDYAGAVEFIKKQLDAIIDGIKNKEKKPRAIVIEAYFDHEAGTAYIGVKFPNRQDIPLVTGFDSMDKAWEYIKEHKEELEEQFRKISKIPPERYVNSRERIGTDYRNGKDISEEQFSSIFKWKGGVFGEWLPQKERQGHLNFVYDSLMDMANILNVMPHILSLNGRLSLSLGASGKGGKGAASAHYSQMAVAINLTRKHGAGAFAHEWWHSFDHYLNYLYSRENLMTRGEIKHEYAFSRIYENLSEDELAKFFKDKLLYRAIKNLTDTISKTKFAKRSVMLDIITRKRYWSTMPEMTARAFEWWIRSRIETVKMRNEYLANFTNKEDYYAELYPYPDMTEDEANDISNAFDKVFGILSFSIDGWESKELVTDPKTGIDVIRKNDWTITEPFKNWFKESKVVDEKGKPLIVFHPTVAKLSAYTFTDQNKTLYGRGELGFYFTPNPELASKLAKIQESKSLHDYHESASIIPAYISMQNPLILTTIQYYNDYRYSDAHSIRRSLKSKGFDGIIIKKATLKEQKTREFIELNEWVKLDSELFEYDQYIVINATQIKSPICNSGRFDSKNPDICDGEELAEDFDEISFEPEDAINDELVRANVRELFRKRASEIEQPYAIDADPTIGDGMIDLIINRRDLYSAGIETLAMNNVFAVNKQEGDVIKFAYAPRVNKYVGIRIDNARGKVAPFIKLFDRSMINAKGMFMDGRFVPYNKQYVNEVTSNEASSDSVYKEYKGIEFLNAIDQKDFTKPDNVFFKIPSKALMYAYSFLGWETLMKFEYANYVVKLSKKDLRYYDKGNEIDIRTYSSNVPIVNLEEVWEIRLIDTTIGFVDFFKTKFDFVKEISKEQPNTHVAIRQLSAKEVYLIKSGFGYTMKHADPNGTPVDLQEEEDEEIIQGGMGGVTIKQPKPKPTEDETDENDTEPEPEPEPEDFEEVNFLTSAFAIFSKRLRNYQWEKLVDTNINGKHKKDNFEFQLFEVDNQVKVFNTFKELIDEIEYKGSPDDLAEEIISVIGTSETNIQGEMSTYYTDAPESLDINATHNFYLSDYQNSQGVQIRKVYVYKPKVELQKARYESVGTFLVDDAEFSKMIEDGKVKRMPKTGTLDPSYKNLYADKIDGVIIYRVKLEKVQEIDAEFVRCGHNYVFPYIPFPEIWIDDSLAGIDLQAAVEYAKLERELMKKGMTHEAASQKAQLHENAFREKMAFISTIDLSQAPSSNQKGSFYKDQEVYVVDRSKYGASSPFIGKVVRTIRSSKNGFGVDLIDNKGSYQMKLFKDFYVIPIPEVEEDDEIVEDDNTILNIGSIVEVNTPKYVSLEAKIIDYENKDRRYLVEFTFDNSTAYVNTNEVKLKSSADIEAPKTPTETVVSLNVNDYRTPKMRNRAVEILLDQKSETYQFSPEEKSFIATYSGNYDEFKKGGTAILLPAYAPTEFYCPDILVKKLWALAYDNGFKDNQNVLEPSAGKGNFLRYAPGNASHVTAIEVGKYGARITRILYPKARVLNQKFEGIFIIDSESVKGDVSKYQFRNFDLVIGCPPMGDFVGKERGMGEMSYTKAKTYAEYFITRSLDLLRPDGLLIFVELVEKGKDSFMSSTNVICKKMIVEKISYFNAIQIPDPEKPFEIIIMKKK